MKRKSRLWPEKRRKKQAETARKHKPWTKSTGPRTDAGKAACRLNALKHGLRSAEIRQFKKLLTAQRAFIRALQERLK